MKHLKEQTQQKAQVSKAKKIYNIISTIAIALVFAFLVVIVAIMLWQRNGGEDANLFGYYTYNVLTDSMQPTINPGDVIISKKVDVNDLKEGDVITFIAPSGPLKGNNITHRIIEIVKNEDGTIKHFITKGDNAPKDNWELSPDAVKARYIKTSTFISGFRNLITKWYGYVLLIVLPICVVFVLIIVGFIKEKVALETQNAEDKAKLDSMSEEEKKKLLEDYLANNNQSSEGQKQDENVSTTHQKDEVE